MDGFVHNAEGYAKSCAASGTVAPATFTDLTGQRAMGYYDQDFLNYYYYMASQFAVSDRWFSPVVEQEHPQSHRDLHRRHDAGPGQGPGQRRPSCRS